MSNRKIHPVLGIVLGLSLVICSPSFLHGQSGNEGGASGVTLRLDPGARSSALGSAYTAEFNDPLSLHFNPAGLGALNKTEGLFTRFQLLSGLEGINLNHFSFVQPVERNLAGLGLSLTSLDYGHFNRTEVNASRNPRTEGLGQFGAEDISISGGFGLSLTESFKAGLTGTYFRANIAGYDASTVTGDLGLQYHFIPAKFVVGFAARNLGGGVEFIREEDPVASVYALGLTSRWGLRDGADVLKLNGDIVSPENSDPYLATGLEFGFYRTLFLRAGYNGAPEANDGFSLGVGVHDQRFEVNYSFVPMGELGNNQRLTLSYVFGGLEERIKKLDTQPEIRKPTADTGSRKNLLNELRQEINYPYIRPGPGASWRKSFEAGRRAYRNGNYVKARQYFLQTYRSNPSSIENLLWLGTMEWYLGHSKKALERMRQVLRLDPNNKIAQKNLRRIKSAVN